MDPRKPSSSDQSQDDRFKNYTDRLQASRADTLQEATRTQFSGNIFSGTPNVHPSAGVSEQRDGGSYHAPEQMIQLGPGSRVDVGQKRGRENKLEDVTSKDTMFSYPHLNAQAGPENPQVTRGYYTNLLLSYDATLPQVRSARMLSLPQVGSHSQVAVSSIPSINVEADQSVPQYMQSTAFHHGWSFQQPSASFPARPSSLETTIRASQQFPLKGLVNMPAGRPSDLDILRYLSCVSAFDVTRFLRTGCGHEEKCGEEDCLGSFYMYLGSPPIPQKLLSWNPPVRSSVVLTQLYPQARGCQEPADLRSTNPYCLDGTDDVKPGQRAPQMSSNVYGQSPQQPAPHQGHIYDQPAAMGSEFTQIEQTPTVTGSQAPATIPDDFAGSPYWS